MFAETIRDQMAKTINYIQPVEYDSAAGLTREVYQQLETDFIPAPLIVLHSPLPEVMAGAWSILRETLLAGSVSRSRKEAVAASVSKLNECPFCVDAHTVLLRATSDHDVANAILHGDFDSIQDPELKPLVEWVLATRTASSDAVHPPFTQHEAPELIGTVITFHYINRIANIFVGDSLLPVPSMLKGLTYRLYAATGGKRIVRPRLPGNSLKFVPRSDLPGDFSWAAKNPAVAGAFAGFAKVVEEAGNNVLPEPVRALVSERVAAWNGELMGMSRRWVDEAIAGLEDQDRPAARLALLGALASYQVDAGVIDDFRSQYPDDAQLISATAWASFTAARRVSNWLVPLALFANGSLFAKS